MQDNCNKEVRRLSYLTGEPKKYLFDGCKLIHHQDRLQDFIDGKRIMPVHIDMGIHKNCNMRCIYCYGIKQKMSKEYIPEDRLLMLADDAKEAGIKSLAIIGDGEPTLNEGLYPFVNKLYELGVDCSVATNGILLTYDKLKVLAKSCKWLRFNISGVNEGYNKIHRGTTIQDYYNLESLVKSAVTMPNRTATIGLQMVLIPECFDQVIPLAKKAVEWGVDYLVIKQFSDPEEAIPVTFDIKKEYAKVESDLKYAASLSNDKTAIIVKWNAMKDSASITGKKEWSFDNCIDLPFIFQISGDGGCYPCGYLFGERDYCYGNVCDTRLSDILNSDRYWDIINKVGRTPLEELCKGQCRHCETLKFMDVLTKTYEEKGDLKESLIHMCGGVEQYEKIMLNPPEHVNFV